MSPTTQGGTIISSTCPLALRRRPQRCTVVRRRAQRGSPAHISLRRTEWSCRVAVGRALTFAHSAHINGTTLPIRGALPNGSPCRMARHHRPRGRVRGQRALAHKGCTRASSSGLTPRSRRATDDPSATTICSLPHHMLISNTCADLSVGPLRIAAHRWRTCRRAPSRSGRHRARHAHHRSTDRVGSPLSSCTPLIQGAMPDGPACPLALPVWPSARGRDHAGSCRAGSIRGLRGARVVIRPPHARRGQ